ncbi:uncharacterized protein LOC112171090 [Rosa chinensis]|uniref:uncharacterized protein LOC112171090 n=1 Tax=Rosa chinensis TaxID=74649 RepID=UPI000D08ED2E|nr:uncharacterized protein LOC112171090 [Rosa chinensis]
MEFQIAKRSAKKQVTFLSDTLNHSWCPPTEPLIKVNVDGAWDKNTTSSGSGVIIRDARGKFIAGSSRSYIAGSIIEAEAIALVDGLKLVKQLNLDNIVMESDSHELISALGNHIEKAMSLGIVTSREANRVADVAAKLAKSRLCTEVWVNIPPTSLVSVLTNDGVPCPH